MSIIELACILKVFFPWRLVVSNVRYPATEFRLSSEIDIGMQFVLKLLRIVCTKKRRVRDFILSLPLTS